MFSSFRDYFYLRDSWKLSLRLIIDSSMNSLALDSKLVFSSSGKTHTMLGKDDNPGITLRTALELYKRIDEVSQALESVWRAPGRSE